MDRLRSWASILEPATRSQACVTAKMPFITPYLALMPDAHLGLGATVGSVIPTEGAIMPAAVGVDIGCGMIASRTAFELADVAAAGDLKTLHAAISRAIPLSAGGANQKQTPTARKRIADLESRPGIEQADRISPKWRAQLGSLGSGNHFIELSTDGHGRVWVFLHSGSRGVGNRLAQRHIKIARDVCDAAGVALPNRDLAYLTEGTDQFDAYIEALRWAQHFAWLNRQEMLDRTVACLAEHMGAPVDRLETIACHHNYTVRETHFGRPVWLSRKGAIDAHAGVRGLIPGSMGTASYVVTGRATRRHCARRRTGPGGTIRARRPSGPSLGPTWISR